MCLMLNKQLTDTWKKRKTGKITVYKIVCVNQNEIDGFYYYSPFYRNFKFKVGWNYSNRKTTKLSRKEIRTEQIHYGIHVFLNHDAALKFGIGLNETIVELDAYYKDFVAIEDGNEAVFTKVWFPKEEYNKVR